MVCDATDDDILLPLMIDSRHAVCEHMQHLSITYDTK